MATPPNEFLAKLKALRANYTQNLPEKIEEIEGCWKRIKAAHDADETLDRLRRLAHGLTGSGASFGFVKLSERARSLERIVKEILRTKTPLESGVVQQIEATIAGLYDASKAQVDNLYEAFPGLRPCVDRAKHPLKKQVVLVEDDESLAATLAGQLRHFDYDVRVFHHPHAFTTFIETNTVPSAVMMDIEFNGDRHAGTQAIQRFRAKTQQQIPVIFISAHSDLAARIAAVRAGGDAYLVKPLVTNELIDTLDQLTQSAPPEPHRVAVIEDTPALANLYAAILENAGMKVLPITNTDKLLQELRSFSPELILLDIYLTDCDGLEIAQVLRQQTAYVGVPIVFLSSETDQDKRLAAMHVGGDEFLTKPIQADHLVASISARAKRFRALHTLMVRDSLTGLYNQTKLKEQLRYETHRSQRHQSNFVFAVIDLDHFKTVNEQYGHLSGDRVLKNVAQLLSQRLRTSDLIGRYGGEEFAVILTNANTQEAFTILDKIREDFSHLPHQDDQGEAFFLTFSCGIASFPTFDQALIIHEKADQALQEAKQNGRNRCICASLNSDSNHTNPVESSFET